MRLLLVADVESPYYYEHYRPGRFQGVDLILACGDLHRSYLEFLATMSNKPLLYVPGNHDEDFVLSPPEGCICADGRLTEIKGLSILGFGGCLRYREGAYMYTEREMARRLRRAEPAIRRAGGLDVLMTHAPARGLNDLDSTPHQGFQCFRDLIDRYRPRLFVHGHIHHSYGANIPRISKWGSTMVVNACEHCLVEL